MLSFFTLTLPEDAKKIEIFPEFQIWMKKTNIFLSASHRKCILLSETVRTVTTSGQYPVRPSCCKASKRLWFNL